jgi:5'-deoxynucleotidase YfbR-like HD superfamily hydrolase
MKCRFNGACIAFYPVAQHAVELSRIVPERLAFAALHHDDSEYILPDVCSPVKPFFPGWKNAERRATSACCKAFGVAEHLLTEIKPYDRRIVADECAAVMAKPRTTWKTRSAPLGIHIIPMSPQQAEAAFVARHNELLNSRTD